MKKKQIGGCDLFFSRDTTGGFITRWLVSHFTSPGAWREEQTEEDGVYSRPLDRGCRVTLKTAVYAHDDKDYLLDYVYDITLVDLRLAVNGVAIVPPKAMPRLSSSAYCVWIPLRKGWNELSAELAARNERASNSSFAARVISKEGVLLGPESFSVKESNDRGAPLRVERGTRKPLFCDKVMAMPKLLGNLLAAQHGTPLKMPSAFKTGIGAAKKSAGRFGFSKGDGLLDCSMPVLGMVAKPYLFGHPDYAKSILWHFTLTPPGIPEQDRYIGSNSREFHVPGEGERIDVTWLSVKWSKQFYTAGSFYHRPKGRKVYFACTYSLASPSIVIETNDAGLRIGDMEAAGCYHNMAIPLREGLALRNCEEGLVYDQRRDGRMSDNWVLMWGNDVFPDVPIMLTFQKNPEKIVFNRNDDDSLNSIDIVAKDQLGWVALQFPFGFEVFKPDDTGGEAWIADAAERCVFLGKTVLAYPIDCKEYYKIDEAGGRVEVIQRFEYKDLTDEWGTKALRTAPLPPPLSLIDDVTGVSLDDGAVDFKFPTKYGYLKGAVGRDWSKYSVPMPTTRREFCLKPSGDHQIETLLHGDFEDYLRYHRSSNEIPNPGVYQFVIQYAIPLLLFNFLNGAERKTLEDITADGVSKAANADTEYLFTGGKKCCSWYRRVEPYTGVDYLMTYLHISGVKRLRSCDKAAIESLQKTFIEVDWGNGFALYSLYLGALLSGNWRAIKENWGTIRKAFDYFLSMQDWACMATAYCEDGISWNDGTNYGGYVGFARMAEIVGDKDSYASVMYAFGKLAALRLAIFRSTQKYFHTYFNHKPWWIAKFFHEEIDAGQAFACVPNLVGDYRMQGIYNLTTEGHYPEAWEMYSRAMPDDVKELLRIVNSSCSNLSGPVPEGETLNYPSGGI